MAFELPALPYETHALEPYISAATLEYHYGKQHQAYINQLNQLVAGTQDADKSLEALITSASGQLLHAAAQVWNHTFYWHCLSPRGGGQPHGTLAEAIACQFGCFEHFKDAFNDMAMDNLGSGWTWLGITNDSRLTIANGHAADCPILHEPTPLLIVDAWEQDYDIDERRQYFDNIWKLINWDFVAQNVTW